jgi:hypothetical protein
MFLHPRHHHQDEQLTPWKVDVLWVVLAGAVMSALIGGRLVPLGLVP